MAQTETEQLDALLGTVEARAAQLVGLRQAWDGSRPAAWLSQKSRTALDGKLSRLGVNIPRLGVRALAERLRIAGFTGRPAGDESDDGSAAVWAAWKRAGMVGLADLAHTDRTLYGGAFVTVWSSAHDDSRPVAMLDNPRTAAMQRDAATGEPLVGVRRWNGGGDSHALVLHRDRMTRWTARGIDAPASFGGWKRTAELANPLGVVPMTPLVRRAGSDDWEGTSYVADVLDLSDALAKVLGDAMTTSEYFARPRRWATGLEIVEDDDGNAVDPFGEGRLMQSESPETKFGQLPSVGLDGYSDLVAVLTQQAGSLLGLPAHYLGLHGDQPPNSESVRASESQLVSTAYAEQRQLDPDWARVAGLLVAVAEPAEPLDLDSHRPVWESPEIRTPAQAADSATKLHGIGVPLRELLTSPLGYSPSDAERIAGQARGELITRAGSQLGKLLP